MYNEKHTWLLFPYHPGYCLVTVQKSRWVDSHMIEQVKTKRPEVQLNPGKMVYLLNYKLNKCLLFSVKKCWCVFVYAANYNRYSMRYLGIPCKVCIIMTSLWGMQKDNYRVGSTSHPEQSIQPDPLYLSHSKANFSENLRSNIQESKISMFLWGSRPPMQWELVV